ncbi:N-6 DNA methylase [Embleya sp. NPDC059237]|uniref:N-6 DNA methylase n=1 Tax=Embleya sp. NPDC059237 TaxID=3346784 RepID=UPI003687827C
MTAADISRLAGVTRATVSNWRRRHTDFPAPTGGSDTSPTYDLAAVRSWLDSRGQLPEDSSADKLRRALRERQDDSKAADFLLPAVLAAARLNRQQLESLSAAPDDVLLAWAREAAINAVGDIPGDSAAGGGPPAAGSVRSLLRCVAAEGPETATQVLAEHLLEESGSGIGAYPTPAPLARLMADLLGGADGAFPTRVFDPACGSGALLAAAAHAGAPTLLGQDIVPGQAGQAAVRLRLAAPDADITIRAGDSLRADAFAETTADAALCNPPYGDRDWGHNDLAYDERWAYGVPPKGESELAWVQHCLAHLVPGGRAVLLMPPAVAERAGARRIRTQLVRDGALRSVIALPQGAATPLHIGLHLWILQHPEPRSDTPGTMLFVDATTKTVAGSRTLDWDDLRRTVLKAWRSYRQAPERFVGIPDIAQSIPLIDLLDETVDLTPARHAHTPHDAVSSDRLASDAEESHTRLRQAVSGLHQAIESGGWPTPGDWKQDWRTAAVADLLRGGALTLLQTPAPGRRTRGSGPQPHLQTARRRRSAVTADDVTRMQSPSGTDLDLPADATTPLIETGDVLLPEIIRGPGPIAVRVVGPAEAGCHLGPHVLLFRPDQRRLDPWFLAGFLAGEKNVNSAATGTSIVRVDPRRLRVPLLPLLEQRRYGAAFRHLHTVRLAARLAEETAEKAARVFNAGLTVGALLPSDHGSA